MMEIWASVGILISGIVFGNLYLRVPVMSFIFKYIRYI